jgi:NarL family two-component system response regulator LiaR
MNGKIRILIADDHPLIRQGLEVVLRVQPDMEVVAAATNGDQAITLTQKTKPDVIIMDLVMPVLGGLAAIKEITKIYPSAHILVLTSFAHDDDIFTAIKEGAQGFLLKQARPEQLLDAVRSVYKGESTLHPTLARKVIQELKNPPPLPPAPEPLTHRQVEVLQYLAQGLSNQEIASQLSVSQRTVTTHIRAIMDKLHLANRTQVALYAHQDGLTRPLPELELAGWHIQTGSIGQRKFESTTAGLV